ncbi:MAG: FtsX-like permease family protein [Chloroflexi bacterium]|nr:FtsX-like permease family protein [Chloroflexota bacterium]
MNELFGVPMSTILAIVVIALIVCAAVIAVLASRNFLLFKMGLRNLPRRPGQTLLIVIGLMLSTLIISAAFATGDTLSRSLRNSAFEVTGPIDHLILYNTAGGRGVEQRGAVVPQRVADDLSAAFADDPDIEHFTRVVSDTVSAENVTTSQFEPRVSLLGIDVTEVQALGGIPDPEGGNIPLGELGELGEGMIILNESAAEHLAARAGDRVRLRVLGGLHEFTVQAIAADTLLSGKVDITEPQGAVIPLADAQTILDQPDRLSSIGVSVRGDGLAGPLEFSEEVDLRLNRFFMEQADAEVDAGLPPVQRTYADAQGRPIFESDPFKADTVDNAETFSSIFTTFFLVMGSFSIVAGILLIFLIFVMLAEERKMEMGIARAVGMQRSHLVQSFLAEGLAYNMGAAIIGTAAGIGISFGMVAVLGSVFGAFGFNFTQYIEPRSVVIAVGISILLTFFTVVVSSFRISQLNIVAAIRDISDDGQQGQRPISGLGILLTLILIPLAPLLVLAALFGRKPEHPAPLRWLHHRIVWGIYTTTIGLILFAILGLTVLLALIGWLALSTPRLGAAIRQRGWGEWAVLPTWRLMRWRQEWWFVLLLAGVIGVGSAQSSESAFLYLGGLSLFVIGLLLLARRFNRAGRVAYSATGLLILFLWLAPQTWHTAVWGKDFEGGVQMFFLSGVAMVTGATIAVIFNLDLLVSPLRMVGRVFGRFAPAVRTAVAYPTTARYRTGMTVAMIAIIMFALVVFTTINATFSEAFVSDEAAGGYDLLADSTLNDDISDLHAALEEAAADDLAANLDTIGRLRIASFPGTDVVVRNYERWDELSAAQVLDATGNPIIDTPDPDSGLAETRLLWLTGTNDAFLQNNVIPLQARATGFDTDAAVWQALNDPTSRYGVVTANAIEADAFAPLDNDAFEMPASSDAAADRIPRVRLELHNKAETIDVTIIGVIDQVVGITNPAFAFFPSLLIRDALVDAIYDSADFTRHLATVRPGTDPLETARAIEATLGIETVSIVDELEEQQETSNAILNLFQGFTGLGLVVGIAALGVIAVRAVVERRQQIGVLRAVGYSRGMVRLELLMEMSFIALIGIGLGIALALSLTWRLFEEGVFGSTADAGMQVPVGQIAIFAAAAFLGALIMTWLPARQASRAPIAEALRYE